jgi:membrane-associated phospholipid phosphatase
MIDQENQPRTDPPRPGGSHPTDQRSARSGRPARLGSPAWWTWPLAGLVCFFLLLWQVASHGPVTGVDIRVRDHILAWSGTPALSWLAALGRGLADLGNPPVAIPVLPIVALFAARRSRSLLPLVIAAGAAVALAIVIPLKIWVGRPGPGTVVLGDASFGYFPSGHTADALLCYGTSALILCIAFPAAKIVRRASIAIAAALIAFTVFGLLWSDYHWLSDILGSFCWCGAALVLLHRFGTVARSRAVPDLSGAQTPLPQDAGNEAHHEPQHHH